MRFVVLLFLLITFVKITTAQVTAQGQGGKTVLWGAVAAEQKLTGRLTNRNILAYSRHSPLENTSVLEQFGVFTVREELVYTINKRFKLSGALMYARRGYNDASHPQYLDELRLYTVFTHGFNWNKVKFSQYIRTDYRLFYEPGFDLYRKPFEFRLRYRMKAAVPLSEKWSFIAMSEFLAATDESVKNGRISFTPFTFTENRSSVYLRKGFADNRLYVDAGVMNQLWKDESIDSFRQTLLFQVDVIFINPFSPPHR